MKTTLKNKQIAAQTKACNVPFVMDEQALHGLVCRIAGKTYADSIVFKKAGALHEGMDRYVVSDTADGKILIEATSGVAAASAFRWYIENRCDSYVGPLNRRLNFPKDPPAVGEKYSDESLCLYRYCLNYCTYGYTFIFWQWEQWEELIDWLMLSGYNLILNPIGNESVWLTVLQKLGYTLEQAKDFICSPTVYPWQCMMNITGWAEAAPVSYYDRRLELARKINARLRSFGAEVVVPGWAGMVPQDFEEHFKDSQPYHQGLWSGMPRPSILLPGDPYFDKVASCYYQTQKELLGVFHYFSIDPFHEGGDSSKVDLVSYARGCLGHMAEVSDCPVWFLQGWGKNPLREILTALPVGNVLIGDLQSEFHTQDDSFANYPWLYGTVDNFGGQRRIRGSMNALLKEPLEYLKDEDLTVVGVCMFPEGLETDEMLFDVIADYAVSSAQADPDEWLKKRLRIRYGHDSVAAFEAWRLIRDHIYNGKETRDSGLLSRPSLDVAHVICQVFEFNYDVSVLEKAMHLLAQDYDLLCGSEAYRMDMMDVARQVISNAAWSAVKGIQDSYNANDPEKLEDFATQLMRYYDLQVGLVSSDKHALLGRWLEMARSNGQTAAEKAYFEFQARTIFTLWGDRAGSGELHDYAAREWDGMLQDFYRPRWESYINILRRSLVTGHKPMEYNRYDAEYYFTTLSKNYPTEPYGDLGEAVRAVQKEITK